MPDLTSSVSTSVITAYDLPTIVNMIRAAEATGVTPMVRVDYDPHLITNVLEAGAMGLFIPDVATAEKAKAVVKAVHFAPLGDRGTYSASRITRYGAISSGEYANGRTRRSSWAFRSKARKRPIIWKKHWAWTGSI